MAALVVAAQEEEGVGVPDLERPEVEHALPSRLAVSRWAPGEDAYFNREVSTIDVVTEEEVPSISGASPDFEKFHQVVLDRRRSSATMEKAAIRSCTYCPWMSPQTERASD